MAGMIKLILLMTLAAVSFLPQNGVEAIQCHSNQGKEPIANCSDLQFCFYNKAKSGGVIKDCLTKEFEANEAIKNRKGDCADLPGDAGRICICKENLCNSKLADSSSGRLRGQSSSVLSVCVVFIFLAISFFGKP